MAYKVGDEVVIRSGAPERLRGWRAVIIEFKVKRVVVNTGNEIRSVRPGDVRRVPKA